MKGNDKIILVEKNIGTTMYRVKNREKESIVKTTTTRVIGGCGINLVGSECHVK